MKDQGELFDELLISVSDQADEKESKIKETTACHISQYVEKSKLMGGYLEDRSRIAMEHAGHGEQCAYSMIKTTFGHGLVIGYMLAQKELEQPLVKGAVN